MPLELDPSDLGLGQREVDAGHVAPTGANTPFIPARAFGAPHTTWSRSLPVSTSQTLSLSALGCFSHLITSATRNGAKRGGRIEQFLDLEPDAGQRVGDRLATLALVSRCSFSHESVNFMAQDSPAASVGMASGGKP